MRSEKRIKISELQRISLSDYSCDCAVCSKANYICSICNNWNGARTDIKCSQCANGYHLNCLNESNIENWACCNDNIHPCQQDGPQRFRFGQKMRIKDMPNYITQINKKYEGKGIDLNGTIEFFRDFTMNCVNYQIGDYVQIKTENIEASAEIYSIHLDEDNTAKCLVEYIWNMKESELLQKKFPNDPNCCTLFREAYGTYLGVIDICSIIGKICIVSSIKQCLTKRKDLEQRQKEIFDCEQRGECTKKLCTDLPCRVYTISHLKFNSKTSQIIENEKEKSSESETESIQLLEKEFLPKEVENDHEIESTENSVHEYDEFSVDDTREIMNDWSDLTDSSIGKDNVCLSESVPAKKTRYKSKKVWNQKSEKDELSDEVEFDSEHTQYTNDEDDDIDINLKPNEIILNHTVIQNKKVKNDFVQMRGKQTPTEKRLQIRKSMKRRKPFRDMRMVIPKKATPHKPRQIISKSNNPPRPISIASKESGLNKEMNETEQICEKDLNTEKRPKNCSKNKRKTPAFIAQGRPGSFKDFLKNW